MVLQNYPSLIFLLKKHVNCWVWYGTHYFPRPSETCLFKLTCPGRLQQISHITPLQVKARKADTSTVQSSPNKDGMEMEEQQGNNDMIAVEIKPRTKTRSSTTYNKRSRCILSR